MIELFEHQLQAVEKLSNGKVLWGGVGSGKSITALHYYLKNEAPKHIYVITTAKKRDSQDWQQEAMHSGILHRDISVDSWNKIGEYTEVEDAFFIFDEQRLVGSGAWVKAFIKIAKKNNWIMLSATPGDTWLDYIPVFVANGYYRNRTDFITQHVVYDNFSKYRKVNRYVGAGRLIKLRKHILVEMPFQKHTKRHVLTHTVEHNKLEFRNLIKNRWNPIEDRPVRDISELFRLMRWLVNSDPSRLEAVVEIHKKHPRLIIFYNFDYELDELRSLSGRLGVVVKEWNGHIHEPVPEGKTWIYLVQYAAGAEGWNCTTTNSVIFYSLNYSYKLTEQALGRIDRLNTPYTDLFYYILKSDSVIDRAIMKALSEKKTFNERSKRSELGLDS